MPRPWNTARLTSNYFQQLGIQSEETICTVGGKEPGGREVQRCDLEERRAQQPQREGHLFMEQNQGEGKKWESAQWVGMG